MRFSNFTPSSEKGVSILRNFLIWTRLPSGNLTVFELENHSFFLMGKSTISMVIFNSYFDITRGYDHWCIIIDVQVISQGKFQPFTTTPFFWSGRASGFRFFAPRNFVFSVTRPGDFEVIKPWDCLVAHPT